MVPPRPVPGTHPQDPEMRRIKHKRYESKTRPKVLSKTHGLTRFTPAFPTLGLFSSHPLCAGIRHLVDAHPEDHLAPAARDKPAHPTPGNGFGVGLGITRICPRQKKKTFTSREGEQSPPTRDDAQQSKSWAGYENRRASVVCPGNQFMCRRRSFGAEKNQTRLPKNSPSKLLTGVIIKPGTSAEPSWTAAGLE